MIYTYSIEHAWEYSGMLAGSACSCYTRNNYTEKKKPSLFKRLQYFIAVLVFIASVYSFQKIRQVLEIFEAFLNVFRKAGYAKDSDRSSYSGVYE
jgi:uncharacterized membrane protein